MKKMIEDVLLLMLESDLSKVNVEDLIQDNDTSHGDISCRIDNTLDLSNTNSYVEDETLFILC